MKTQTRITLEEYLALPDDGRERWVIDGILHEGGDPMSRRNRYHSVSMTHIAHELRAWNLRQPEPRGKVLTGDAGFILGRDPLLSYGIDVAYVTDDVWNHQNDSDTTMIEGAPLLAIEIISPSNTYEDLNDKIKAFFAHGTPMFWVIDPYWKVVDVYRPGENKIMRNNNETLSGEPILAGLEIPVARLFG